MQNPYVYLETGDYHRGVRIPTDHHSQPCWFTWLDASQPLIIIFYQWNIVNFEVHDIHTLCIMTAYTWVDGTTIGRWCCAALVIKYLHLWLGFILFGKPGWGMIHKLCSRPLSLLFILFRSTPPCNSCLWISNLALSFSTPQSGLWLPDRVGKNFECSYSSIINM